MVDATRSLPADSLNIAVLGMGGIGSAIAFQLARMGQHHVTAIARPNSARLMQVRDNGGIVRDDGQREAMMVLERIDEGCTYDVVIVTIQAHRLDQVLPSLSRSAARCILFMFNTFDPEILRAAVGGGRCCFGMPFLQAVIEPSGNLHATIGAGGQKSKLSNPSLVDLFNSAGLPAVLEPDMPLWLRCHTPLCIAFESISVAGVRRGGAAWADAITIARGVKESYSLIIALGYRIYPSGKARLARSPVWLIAAALWAVSRVKSFRELLATGIDECRALVDVLLLAALQANSPIRLDLIGAMKPIGDPKESP